MRSLIWNAVVLSVLVGVAGAACSSSTSGSGAGGSGGVAGSISSGGTGHSGSANAGAGGSSSQAGSSNAGSGGSSNAGSGGAAAGSGGASPGGASGAENAGAPDGMAGAAGDTSGPQACNTLTNSAPMIQATHAAAAALPTLAQGTIQSGTYYLSAATSYDGGTGTQGESLTAQVVVNDHTATINLADSAGLLNTIVIVMGTPTSSPAVSIKLVCTSDPAEVQYVGAELKASTSYGVTGNTLSLLIGTTLSVLTLQA